MLVPKNSDSTIRLTNDNRAALINFTNSISKPPENDISQMLNRYLFPYMSNHLSPQDLKALMCLDKFWNNLSIIWLRAEEASDEFSWISAAKSGNLEKIQELIKKTPSLLNKVDEQNNNAAHLAAKNGHVELIDFFHHNSDLILQYNKDGFTPIHLAIIDNQMIVIEHILKNNYLIMMPKTSKGMNELQLAALNGRHEIFKMIYDDRTHLIHSKIIATPCDNMSILLIETPCDNLLQFAIAGKNKITIDLIIKKHPNQILEGNQSGEYPIHTAIKFGNLELVKLLEKINPSLMKMDPYEETILHAACSPNGSFEVFKYIYNKFPLKRKAYDKNGRQPVHIAIANNRFDIVDLYIKKHPGILKDKTKKGHNCLHCVETFEMAKYIYESEKSLLFDNSIISPLHLASKKGEFETVQLYLSCKQNLHTTKDNDGNNILHLAIRGIAPYLQKPGYQEDRIKLIRFLIADYPQLLDEKDKEGKHPYQYANKEITNEMLAANVKYRQSRQISKPASENVVSLTTTTAHQNLNVAPDVSQLTQDTKHSLQDFGRISNWFYTIAKSDLETIQSLCREDPSLLNITDSFGFNTAHRAVMDADPSKIDFFYGNPLLFIEYNKVGYTPFHLAIIEGKAEAIKYLCKKNKLFINMPCKHYGYNPLQLAAAYGQYTVFEILYKLHPEQIDTQHNNGNILHLAIQGGNLSIIEFLGKNYPQFISKPNGGGLYPIHIAIKAGQLNTVTLLEKKCPTLIRESTPEGTSLHLACQEKGEVKIVEHILKNKKNSGMNRTPDSRRCLPFHLAVANGRLDFVQRLIEIDKTIISSKAEDGNNALHLVRDLETAKYLCKKEPKLLFELAENGYNPLQAKASLWDFDLTKFFLSLKNAPYSVKTKDGNNLLHLAVLGDAKTFREGSTEAQKQLVIFLADNFPEFLSQKNHAGHQAHEIAKKHIETDIINYMIDAQLKQNTKEIEEKRLEAQRLESNIVAQKSRIKNVEQVLATKTGSKPPVILSKKQDPEIKLTRPQPENQPSIQKSSLPSIVNEKNEAKPNQLPSSDMGTKDKSAKEPVKPNPLKTLAKKVNNWSNTVGMSKEEKELRNEEKAKRWFKRKLEGIDPTASMSQSECSRSILSEASEVEASIAEEGFQKLIDARVADSSGKSNKDIIFGVLNELKEAKIIKVGTGKNNKIHATYICGSSKPPSLTIHMHNHDKPWHEQFRVIKHFVLFIAACGIDTTEIEKELHYNSVQASKNNTNDNV